MSASTVNIKVPSPVIKPLSELPLGAMFVQETDLGAPVVYLIADIPMPSGDILCMVLATGQTEWIPITLPPSTPVILVSNVGIQGFAEFA